LSHADAKHTSATNVVDSQQDDETTTENGSPRAGLPSKCPSNERAAHTALVCKLSNADAVPKSKARFTLAIEQSPDFAFFGSRDCS
jgi:hypothetical protein